MVGPFDFLEFFEVEGDFVLIGLLRYFTIPHPKHNIIRVILPNITSLLRLLLPFSPGMRPIRLGTKSSIADGVFGRSF